MFILAVENQQYKNELQSGQKIYHNRFGRGIIVGFSSLTDDPLVFFYNPKAQTKHRNRAIRIKAEEIYK